LVHDYLVFAVPQGAREKSSLINLRIVHIELFVLSRDLEISSP
jgi:hypothetical protein